MRVHTPILPALFAVRGGVGHSPHVTLCLIHRIVPNHPTNHSCLPYFTCSSISCGFTHSPPRRPWAGGPVSLLPFPPLPSAPPSRDNKHRLTERPNRLPSIAAGCGLCEAGSVSRTADTQLLLLTAEGSGPSLPHFLSPPGYRGSILMPARGSILKASRPASGSASKPSSPE